MTEAEKMRDAASWLPCPLCGESLHYEGDGMEHPASDTCPLDSMWVPPDHMVAWNRRALPIPPVDVNGTGFCEHQTGLVLTGERKADVSAGLLDEVKAALRAAGDALADSQWSGGSAERKVAAALAKIRG